MNIRTRLKENQFVYRLYLKYKFSKTIKICEERKSLNIEEVKKIIEHDYYKRINESIDWENPKKYTEIMQWKKLYSQDYRRTEYSDKILVRNYVKNVIGQEYLIPLIGKWAAFDDIDFDMLPNSFVLKTNHGSGTNIIVKDKNRFDKKTAKILVNGWMKTDFGYSHGFELHYSDITRMIFVEQYIETKGNDLQDYKFLCFDGKAHFCWVDVDRNGDHRRNVYDLNWDLQPWGQVKKNTDNVIPKPENFELMITLAEKLATGFSHVRVDLYNVDGKIYFGEMTFTNGSGYDLIYPRKYDLKLGELWKNFRED
ncbi:ATP-grasp fold amidoligase family protein [Bacillus massilinigeriensis]|uniref:ATP-grasp fold amidoligase family protein n=1 Tax=Bacillus mediterraneensis TaxID=1805474 RepID=UPI0008F8C6DF|nr:ATP-grasp fold amidoligase family protein [Bacillus mediterraneensis]